ncbi:MAG: DUF3037 domain-containing protein [Polyangiaceae bacterium]|nr:DUF3037 domain-containing protein [Polyangiaceae bacterium]
MTSYYSVVRFVPSSLAEEFVNVGVLTFGDGAVRGRFLEDWSRVELFAQSERLVSARAFQEWVQQSMVPEGPSDRRTKRIDEETVKRLAVDWQGSIQLTAPRASLLEPDALLDDVAPTFLVEPDEPEKPARSAPHATDKRRLVGSLKDALKGAVAEKIDKSQHVIVSTRSPVSADMRARLFDVVVSNGVARCAAQCFNFAVSDPWRVLEHVDASAFAMQDVRKKLPNLLLAMVVSAASNKDDAHEIARKAAKEVNAEFILDSEVDAWADVVIGQVAKTLNP